MNFIEIDGFVDFRSGKCQKVSAWVMFLLNIRICYKLEMILLDIGLNQDKILVVSSESLIGFEYWEYLKQPQSDR